MLVFLITDGALATPPDCLAGGKAKDICCIGQRLDGSGGVLVHAEYVHHVSVGVCGNLVVGGPNPHPHTVGDFFYNRLVLGSKTHKLYCITSVSKRPNQSQ